MRRSYTVTARRWARGWELHIDGVGVTQSRSLASAEGMVRDYICMDFDVEPDSFDVTITPEVSALDVDVQAARTAIDEAAAAQRAAALQSRAVARALKDAGLSGADVAAVLGVSTQRVSQLLKAS